jgi:hypothetical protein
LFFLATGMALAAYTHGILAILALVVALAALPAIQLRQSFKWPVALLIATAAFAAGAWSIDMRAESQAKSFCARFAVGGPLAAVVAAAATEGESRLRRIDKNEVSVGFTGITPLDRHLCVVEGENGVVKRVRYVYLD